MSYNLILLRKTNSEHDKWRLLVMTITLIFFLASFIFVVLDSIVGIFDLDSKYPNCSANAPQTHDQKFLLQPNIGNFLAPNSCNILKNHQCEITCEGSVIVDSDIIEKSHYNTCEDADILLTLNNVNFKDRTIQEGWLKKFPKMIITLQIEFKELTFLEKRSFAGGPFIKLKSLTLINTNTWYIKKDIFEGSTLLNLQFRCTEMEEINFEDGALKYIANSLESLQLNTCKLHPQALKNLTGSIPLTSLATLDLRFNYIEYIINQSFIGPTSLLQLYLSTCGIQKMDKNALLGVGHSVQLLNINNNSLRTLPDGIFREFRSRGTIQIDSNHWNCNCDLEWLKTFYINNSHNYFKDGNELFQCDTDNGIKNYSEVDFCPPSTTVDTTTLSFSPTTTTKSSTKDTTTTNGTTTSMRPTTTTSVTTTKRTTTIDSTISVPTVGPTASILTSTSSPEDFISFVCKDCMRASPFNLHLSRDYSHSVAVRNGSIIYDFYQIQGTPYYDINLRNSIYNDYMIWFNVDNHDEMGCLYNVNEKVTLESLNYARKYLICLLKSDNDVVSPFDCTSLLVPPTWENTPWIFNKDKVLLLVLLIIIILIAVLVSAGTIYFMIRNNPKLIKATKKVNTDKTNTFDKDYQYVNPLSFYSTSDGYLTPKMNKRITSMNSMRRLSRKLSTISERDFEGPFSVIYNVSKINEQLYEPPPLPPNHPSKWRKIEMEDEHLSSAPEESLCDSIKLENNYITNSVQENVANSKNSLKEGQYLDCF